jgi:hypothetical protein
MMDDVKDCRSLIVPLFFVPLGKLKSEDWFKDNALTDLHKQLLIKCAEHDFHWAGNLLDMGFNEKWWSPAIRGGYKVFAWAAKRKVKKHVKGFH